MQGSTEVCECCIRLIQKEPSLWTWHIHNVKRSRLSWIVMRCESAAGSMKLVGPLPVARLAIRVLDWSFWYKHTKCYVNTMGRFEFKGEEEEDRCTEEWKVKKRLIALRQTSWSHSASRLAATRPTQTSTGTFADICLDVKPPRNLHLLPSSSWTQWRLEWFKSFKAYVASQQQHRFCLRDQFFSSARSPRLGWNTLAFVDSSNTGKIRQKIWLINKLKTRRYFAGGWKQKTWHAVSQVQDCLISTWELCTFKTMKKLKKKTNNSASAGETFFFLF